MYLLIIGFKASAGNPLVGPAWSSMTQSGMLNHNLITHLRIDFIIHSTSAEGL